MRRLLLRAMSFAGSQLRHTRLAQSALLNRIFASLALKAYASNEANVASLRVHFDRRDQVIAKRLVLYGGHERAEIELLCSLARPGDQMLDVGANIGLYTLHLSRAVGPKGCVVAVEPDPDNLALLRKNLKINSCLNVIVIPAAFGAKPARMRLFQDAENRGKLSFVDLANSGRFIIVDVRRGEDVLHELGLRPRLVKIDVEGAEPQVLAGLGYDPEVILFEFMPEFLRAQGHNPSEFLSSLQEHGYALEAIDAETGARTSGSPASLLSLAIASPGLDGAGINVLATHSSVLSR